MPEVPAPKKRRASSGSSLNASLEFMGLTPVFLHTWRTAARTAERYCPAGGRVIELGCGTGGLTRALARQGFRCTAAEWDVWLLQEAGHHVRRAEENGSVDLLLLDGDHVPVAERTFDLAACFLELNGRTEEEQGALLAEMRRLAPAVLLLDWQMPERNVHLPATSLTWWLGRLLSDRDDWNRRRLYDQTGGLEGVLYREKGRLHMLERRSCLGGSMGLAFGLWRE